MSTTPAGTTAADGIAHANRAFAEAFGAGEVGKLLDVFYAPGALVDGHGMLPATTDPDTITGFFQAMRDQGFERAELVSADVVDHGVWAVESGVATLRGATDEQVASIDYTVIWRPIDGDWRAQADVFAPKES